MKNLVVRYAQVNIVDVLGKNEGSRKGRGCSVTGEVRERQGRDTH